MGIDSIISYKAPVDDRLTTFLKNKEKELSRINPWGNDVTQRLLPFVTAGKTIRGSLTLYTYSLFQKDIPAFVVDAAAALELVHAGFLIHDDIMDLDITRRGKTALYQQYQQLAANSHGQDTEHFGRSMGINTADICFFLAYEMLGSLPKEHAHVTRLIASELSLVVVAQMQDVSAGHLPARLTKDEILSLYQYKTARYTFSLPLIVGGSLAAAENSTIKSLEQLGETVGLLFQLRDDELSLSGKTEVTGKPVGSDERNKKQTLSTLLSRKELQEYSGQLSTKARGIIEKLPFTPAQKEQLEELVVFCQTRNK